MNEFTRVRADNVRANNLILTAGADDLREPFSLFLSLRAVVVGKVGAIDV